MKGVSYLTDEVGHKKAVVIDLELLKHRENLADIIEDIEDAVAIETRKDEASALAVNPRPGGVKKLENFANSYRVRVGQYRIVYEIADRALLVEVVKVGNRKEVYRNK
ncbi:type II toxin-antitoxin system RelE/ParE family toxin [Dyadobacter sp. 50-39]|uniref:type II toxin-antitoxin system RelE family toxin n=1 Tax=Dyadobacter sp. 50-39 TaxID=1895756 RepID=UPI000B2FC56F|nr:type II toxin-antitoxin system RelE/ParE family toxin [Dyadobacter sp. 50-39]